MTIAEQEPRGGYRPPDPVEVPPLYSWPPRPVAALRWLLFDLWFPWGFVYVALAPVVWIYLTPGVERMETLEVGWVALVWMRNALLLSFLAGGLHWWLYIRRSQGQDYKYVDRWPATDSAKFLWGHQVRDNMFWSLASGVTIWSLYEALTLWAWSSGRINGLGWDEAPVYLAVMTTLVLFWSTTHFWLNHRLLHWRPLYRAAHELHHRNVNIGPWTGISMHPIEHLIYFSVFLLWWVVPAHPTVIILSGFFNGLSPAVTHSGFDQLTLGRRARVTVGDLFHQLHHRHFEVNYGNTPSPIDALAGTWHDGTDEAQEELRHRRRVDQT